MKLSSCRTLFISVLILCLSGCAERDGLAPIEESQWHPFSLHQKNYTVRKGDTLYAVAFKYDKDYRELAIYNNLKRPYALKIGQTLKLASTNTGHKRAIKRRMHRDMKVKRIQRIPPQRHGAWSWPAKGRVVERYMPLQRRKGINISGRKGDKIRASSNGVVAYAGNGLVGYGNLIIIKHNSEYLTAYGNNSKNLVKEGQIVKQGQIIADMGQVARKYWGVHFEVRKNGKPVNPLKYLQKG